MIYIRKILTSILTLGVVAVVAVAATNAFFSDEETSTGNTFVAGDLDLTIDNESYLLVDGSMVAQSDLSWELKDLVDEVFFDYEDLKPGDLGEDTISFHVSNDSWLCAEATLTSDDEVNATDQELADGDTADDAGNDLDGELGSQLNFAFWADDGDNVFESDESVFMSGDAATVLSQVWTLSDSTEHNVGGTDATTGPLVASNEYFVGKAWCFGTLTESAETQDDNNTSGPDQRTSGFTCDGSGLDNTAMTDSLTADLAFTATQARNNPEFTCGQ